MYFAFFQFVFSFVSLNPSSSWGEKERYTPPQNFLRNIFKSKPHYSIASGHAQMTHFEMWSDITGFFRLFWHFKTTSKFLWLET